MFALEFRPILGSQPRYVDSPCTSQ